MENTSEAMKGAGPYKSCDDCQGAGAVIGSVDDGTGDRTVAECQRCAGTGALILRGLRKGQPFYARPKV